jgi:hypothetical protein
MRARSIFALAVVPFVVASSFVGAGCFVGADDFSCDCPDDGHACTEEKCVDGACVHDVFTGHPPDDDAGECLSLDCQGGVDAVTVPDASAVPDDFDACTADSCGADGAIHDPLPAGAPCDQGKFCDTEGHCLACDDFDDCTTQDCSSGAVVVTGHEPAGTTCTHTFDGDGYCTAAGTCELCDDSNPCTVDDCSSGTAVHTPIAEGGACESGGEEGICESQVCVTWCLPLPDPSSCPDGGTYESGGADDDVSGGPNFPDDDGAPRPICGVQKGSGDADYVSYYAADRSFENDINDFMVWSYGKELQFCAYEKCSVGATTVTCLDGSIAATDPATGDQGCCWTKVFDDLSYVEMNLACDNATDDDSGWVHMKFQSADGDPCVPYALLDYGY